LFASCLDFLFDLAEGLRGLITSDSENTI